MNMEIYLEHKKTGEVLIFDTQKDAAKFLGYSRQYISKILKGKANNTTDYFITDQLQC